MGADGAHLTSSDSESARIHQTATTAHRNAQAEDENGKKLVIFYVPSNAATMSICKESRPQ